jgi:RNA polymerase sigma-70 factor, ECF subfamily
MRAETAKRQPAPRTAHPPDPAVAARLAAARRGNPDEFSGLIEPYRRELQVHCYRILGSLHDAEDLVQETMLRAWRRLDTYEGRASFRAWLYKIATNACLDVLASRKRARRVLPPATHPTADPRAAVLPPLMEPMWLEPFPDEWLVEAAANPEARYSARESVSLAFLVALQLLPPRQRAVLILCDVLDWRAREVAELLGLTASAVNSALHRARTTLARHYHARPSETAQAALADERQRALLHQYVRAWEAADVDGLVALLKDEAVFTMPPSPSWYRGRLAIGAFAAATIFKDEGMFPGKAAGRWRLAPIHANTQPAFAVYERDPSGGGYHAFALQVLTFDGDQLAEVGNFIDPSLFAFFGLPAAVIAE